MEQLINAITEHIKNWTLANVSRSPLAVKDFGFCELVYRESEADGVSSTQPIPMTINGTDDRDQVSLDDEFDFMVWARWVDRIFSNPNVEDQWGLKEGKRKVLPLRVVIAHKVELGEDLIVDIAENLPERITLAGFDYIFLERWSINPDHEAIYNTELGKTVYELHRFNWNLYVLDLEIEFKQCVDFVPSTEYITDEQGNCLTVD